MKAFIVYKTIESEEIDKIRFLWEKLREHHLNNSNYFKEKYREQTFQMRKAGLLKKIKDGKLRIDIAENTKDGILVAYCVSSVNIDDINKEGEIDSIYVEENFRKSGIATNLVESALSWFKNENVSVTRISVAEGNEQAFAFYEKFGFYHLMSVLQQRNKV
jgi:ribosomal protein S18 acetylase RimI-like enzyme